MPCNSCPVCSPSSTTLLLFYRVFPYYKRKYVIWIISWWGCRTLFVAMNHPWVVDYEWTKLIGLTRRLSTLWLLFYDSHIYWSLTHKWRIFNPFVPHCLMDSRISRHILGIIWPWRGLSLWMNQPSRWAQLLISSSRGTWNRHICGGLTE